MTMELLMLLGAVGLYFVLTTIPAVTTAATIGPVKAAGSRDEAAPRTGKAGRCDRALANHGEAMMMFTPVVLTAHVLGAHADLTVLGAQLFLGGRIVHAITYLLGIPIIKPLAYAVELAGIVMIAVQIFQA